jgi:phosphohistidine phosphatase
MDLILWRHAEAYDLDDDTQVQLPTSTDLARELTPRGFKQAARMASWLDRQLPEGTKIYSSAAVRAEQTVKALQRKYKIRTDLNPDTDVDKILGVAQWPGSDSPVLLVGHQPSMGAVIAQLMGLQASSCNVKKGAVWWLRTRQREGLSQTVLVTVQTPEYL